MIEQKILERPNFKDKLRNFFVGRKPGEGGCPFHKLNYAVYKKTEEITIRVGRAFVSFSENFGKSQNNPESSWFSQSTSYNWQSFDLLPQATNTSSEINRIDMLILYQRILYDYMQNQDSYIIKYDDLKLGSKQDNSNFFLLPINTVKINGIEKQQIDLAYEKFLYKRIRQEGIYELSKVFRYLEVPKTETTKSFENGYTQLALVTNLVKLTMPQYISSSISSNTINVDTFETNTTFAISSVGSDSTVDRYEPQKIDKYKDTQLNQSVTFYLAPDLDLIIDNVFSNPLRANLLLLKIRSQKKVEKIFDDRTYDKPPKSSSRILAGKGNKTKGQKKFSGKLPEHVKPKKKRDIQRTVFGERRTRKIKLKSQEGNINQRATKKPNEIKKRKLPFSDRLNAKDGTGKARELLKNRPREIVKRRKFERENHNLKARKRRSIVKGIILESQRKKKRPNSGKTI